MGWASLQTATHLRKQLTSAAIYAALYCLFPASCAKRDGPGSSSVTAAISRKPIDFSRQGRPTIGKPIGKQKHLNDVSIPNAWTVLVDTALPQQPSYIINETLGIPSHMQAYIIAVAVLHAGFMVAELYPWENPFLLQVVSKKLPDGEKLSANQTRLVATIVKNAGIYNAILAGGLTWVAYTSDTSSAVAVAKVLLIGAGVAGLFGTLTLQSPLTAIQAVAGIVGVLLVASRGLG